LQLVMQSEWCTKKVVKNNFLALFDFLRDIEGIRVA